MPPQELEARLGSGRGVAVMAVRVAANGFHSDRKGWFVKGEDGKMCGRMGVSQFM